MRLLALIRWSRWLGGGIGAGIEIRRIEIILSGNRAAIQHSRRRNGQQARPCNDEVLPIISLSNVKSQLLCSVWSSKVARPRMTWNFGFQVPGEIPLPIPGPSKRD
jgi:hypothetical protein